MRTTGFGIIRTIKAVMDSEHVSRKRLMLLGGGVVILLLFLFAVGGHYGILSAVRLSSEREQLVNSIARLEFERDSLKQSIERMKNDKNEIERIARENFGMAKPGEKVFKFQESGTAKP